MTRLILCNECGHICSGPMKWGWDGKPHWYLKGYHCCMCWLGPSPTPGIHTWCPTCAARSNDAGKGDPRSEDMSSLEEVADWVAAHTERALSPRRAPIGDGRD